MKTILCTGLCLLTLASTAQAEQAGGFTNTLSVGLTLTDGNSETLQANISVVSEGEKEGLGAVRAGAEANYGHSTVQGQKDTTVENARLFAHAQKTISPRTFASLDTSLLYDDIAHIDYRAVLAPGLGLFLVKTEQTSLYVEVGPAYAWERVADIRDDYIAFRLAERVSYAFSPTARLWQSVEYLPKAKDFSDYLLNAELGVEAALNARIRLRVVVQNKYDSTPGEDLDKNDLALIAGISLSL